MHNTNQSTISGLYEYAYQGRFRQNAARSIAAAIESIKPSAGITVGALQASESALSVTLSARNLTTAVRVGDTVEVSLSLTYRAGRQEGLEILPTISRLVCTNLQTVRECGVPSHILTSRDDAHLFEIERAIPATLGGLPGRLNDIRALSGTRADVPRLLEDSSRRAGLDPRELQPVLLDAWREEGGEASEYGAWNALTRVATHDRHLSNRERVAIGQVAGVLAFRRSHVCNRCCRTLTWVDSNFVQDVFRFVRAGLTPTGMN